MIGPILSGVARQRYGAGNVNIVFVGNSIMAGYGLSTDPVAQTRPLDPLNGAVPCTKLAYSGYTITDLRGVGSAADAAYVSGETNILFFQEGTNTVGNSGAGANKTGAAAGADAGLYCADRLAVHPDWKIILVTAYGRWDNNNGAGPAANNLQLMAYNQYLKDNFRAMGAKAVSDVLSTGEFVCSGATMPDSMAPFMVDLVHPNEAGDAVYAKVFAASLKRLPAR